MALFTTGETAPFALGVFIVVVWGCGAGASLGPLVSMFGPGLISQCVYEIRIREWHFDTQYLGPLLGCESSWIFLLLEG